jgi:hypothetical protein
LFNNKHLVFVQPRRCCETNYWIQPSWGCTTGAKGKTRPIHTKKPALPRPSTNLQ